MFAIRTAKLGDKKALEQIYGAAGDSQLTLDDEYCDRLLQIGGLVVAEADGRIIGFGAIDVNETEQLKWLYLRPEHQRTGTGSQILGRLEEIAWKAGLSSIRLHSAPGAVEFYLRRGYSMVAEIGTIGHDHDGVEMIKVRSHNN